MHVSPSTDSQTVQDRHVLTRQDKKQTVSSAWGTQHCQWFARVHCVKLQVISSEVFLCKRTVFIIFSSCQGSVYIIL